MVDRTGLCLSMRKGKGFAAVRSRFRVRGAAVAWLIAVCASVGPSSVSNGQFTNVPTGAVVEAAPLAELQFAEGDVRSNGLVIDGRQIAWRTVQNWTPAKILRARGRSIVQAYAEEDECARQAATALDHFLNMQADHQEDIGAASGLRAYYTRIAIDEQLRLNDESLELLNSESNKQMAARSGGLAASTDMSGFERQELEIKDRELQLKSQDRQLRNLLAQLACIDYDMRETTSETLEVVAMSLDCQRLVEIALNTRHDIRGWRYLSGQINETSAPIFAKTLASLIGSFGLPIPTSSAIKALLCPPDYEGLVRNMRREAGLTVDMHRRWITQAVEEKCALAELAYARIELAQQGVNSWQQRIDQLKRVEEMGEPAPEQSAEARVGWLKARGEEVSRRLEARLAEIDLAEACGRISNRCCDGQPWLLTGH